MKEWGRSSCLAFRPTWRVRIIMPSSMEMTRQFYPAGSVLWWLRLENRLQKGVWLEAGGPWVVLQKTR